jgi:uncharacterized protein YndB with AHSA1/START domain
MNTENQTQAKRPVTASIRAAETACAISDGDIVLARIDVPAPPERVFRALLTDECERWWGAPGVYTTDTWKADVRAGGSWSLVTRLPDGTGLPASGDFIEVSPSRIVQSRRYHFDYPILGQRVTRVTTLLMPIDGGTRVVVRHEDFGASQPAFEHAGGWQRLLDWLGAYLSRGEGGSR